VRRGLLDRITGGDVLTGLPPAVKAVGAGWREPVGQDGKGLPARLTDSAPHPDAFVLVIVSMAEPSSVTNDRVIPAYGTSPRQEGQGDHPESPLSSVSGSAIKRITAGVKAAADRRCRSFDLRPAFTLPPKSVRTKQEYCVPVLPRPLTQNIGRFFGVSRQLDHLCPTSGWRVIQEQSGQSTRRR
jgi:hypothetical protein